MAWDIQQNFQTGDWIFNSVRDYASAEGANLVQQRIHVRLKTERGSFMYDRSGNLGSRLLDLVRLPGVQAAGGIEMIVREALAPMDDITITDVVIDTDVRQLKATIHYRLSSLQNSPDLSTTVLLG